MNVTSARIDIKIAAGAGRARPGALRRAARGAPRRRVAGAAARARLAARSSTTRPTTRSAAARRTSVVDQVLIRFAEAEQIGRGIADRRDPAARGRRAAAASAVVVNPSPFERTDVVEVDLAVPAAWETVELELPDGGRVPTQLVERPETVLRRLQLTRATGPRAVRPSPARPGAVRAFARRPPRSGWRRASPSSSSSMDDPARPGRLRRRHPPRCRRRGGGRRSGRGLGRHRRARRSTAARWPPCRCPPSGRRRSAPSRRPSEPATAADPGRRGRPLARERARSPSTVGGRRHAHDRVAAASASPGSGRIVDGGDFGDTYNYGPPADDRLVERPQRGRRPARSITARSAASSTSVARYDWPVGLTPDGAARSEATAPVEITTRLELRAGEPFVRVEPVLHEPVARPPGPLASAAASGPRTERPPRASSPSSSAA